jgi:hypothetical protein
MNVNAKTGPIAFPSQTEFKKGSLASQRHEKRDAMYRIASFLVEHFWGKAADIADGLGVLLLTWNQALYRYGQFDFGCVEQCIKKHQALLETFRSRNIRSFGSADEQIVATLFDDFLDALRIVDGSKAGTKSPVATAKALHLLAPAFFPLWDNKIARAYGCHYTFKPAAKYIRFMEKTQAFAKTLGSSIGEGENGRTLLKLIDEYNYAKYTKHWI